MNKRPSRRRPARDGFTLLEILLALSILSVMGIMVFGSFRSLVDATTRAEDAMDELHVVETLSRRIGDSLRAAAWFDTDGERYEFRHEVEPVTPPRDWISWVTPTPPFGIPEGGGGLHRVELNVDDADGEDALLMKVYSSLWDEEDEEVEDLEPVVISRSVIGLKAHLYDAQEQEWVDEWTRTRQIPLAVALTLYLEAEEPGRAPREVTLRVDPALAPLGRDTRRGRRRVAEPATAEEGP